MIKKKKPQRKKPLTIKGRVCTNRETTLEAHLATVFPLYNNNRYIYSCSERDRRGELSVFTVSNELMLCVCVCVSRSSHKCPKFSSGLSLDLSVV